MNEAATVRLGGLAYGLGRLCPLEELRAEGNAPELVDALVRAGLTTYSKLEGSTHAVVRCVVSNSLARAGIVGDGVDDVVIVSESSAQLSERPLRRGETPFFAARNQLVILGAQLGLTRSAYHGVSFGGSNNFLHALRFSVALLETGRSRAVLLLSIDRHPPGITRIMEDALAVTGDAVAACVLTIDALPARQCFEIEHVGVTAYSGSLASSAVGVRVLEMYRSVKSAAADCYEATNRQPGEYDHLVLNNYNETSTKIFSRLLGFDRGRVYDRNLIRTGHAPGSDAPINLCDLTAEASILDDARILVFGTGPSTCGTVSLRLNVAAPGAV